MNPIKRRLFNNYEYKNTFHGGFNFVERVEINMKKKDLVDHPEHYQSDKFEVIDIIDNFKLGFSLGNAIKYILRAGRKDPAKTLEDLEKAAWYINHEIKKLKEEK